MLSSSTPLSVPSFKPQSTEQNLTEAAKVCPQVKQEDGSSLSTKAYDALHEATVKGLSTNSS